MGSDGHPQEFVHDFLSDQPAGNTAVDLVTKLVEHATERQLGRLHDLMELVESRLEAGHVRRALQERFLDGLDGLNALSEVLVEGVLTREVGASVGGGLFERSIERRLVVVLVLHSLVSFQRDGCGCLVDGHTTRQNSYTVALLLSLAVRRHSMLLRNTLRDTQPYPHHLEC